MDYYRPEYSSPLNPSRDTPPRRNKPRRNVSISPAQRLLRYKAAEAWRSYVLLQEAREYERVLMETIASREKAVSLRPDRKKDSLGRLQSLRYGLDTTLESRDDERGGDFDEEAQQDVDVEYQFHMPDLSFFTPRRVALAMGLMRRLPVGGWLRCEESC